MSILSNYKIIKELGYGMFADDIKKIIFMNQLKKYQYKNYYV